MAHYTPLDCSVCKQRTLRELLFAKVVSFRSFETNRIVKSRTTIWICNECIKEDPDWNMEAYKSAPGLISPALERVKKLGGNP